MITTRLSFRQCLDRCTTSGSAGKSKSLTGKSSMEPCHSAVTQSVPRSCDRLLLAALEHRRPSPCSTSGRPPVRKRHVHLSASRVLHECTYALCTSISQMRNEGHLAASSMPLSQTTTQASSSPATEPLSHPAHTPLLSNSLVPKACANARQAHCGHLNELPIDITGRLLLRLSSAQRRHPIDRISTYI